MTLFQCLLPQCPVCGSQNIAFWREKLKMDVAFKLWNCKDCQSGFLNPRPTKMLLENIYQKSGHGLERPISLQEVNDNEALFPNSSLDAKRLFAIPLKQFYSKKPLNVLDIGSGYGFYTAEALEYTNEVTAINPSIWENNVFQEMNGFRPIEAFFEDVNCEETYDIVIISQVLEHIADPTLFLNKVYSILNKDGISIIAVPNINSISVKLRGLKDNSCFWVPEHLNYFSKKGLHALATRTGFRTVEYTSFGRMIPRFLISRAKGLSTYLIKLFFISQTLPMTIINKLEFGLYQCLWVKK